MAQAAGGAATADEGAAGGRGAREGEAAAGGEEEERAAVSWDRRKRSRPKTTRKTNEKIAFEAWDCKERMSAWRQHKDNQRDKGRGKRRAKGHRMRERKGVQSWELPRERLGHTGMRRRHAQQLRGSGNKMLLQMKCG
jgi:hypothetical protein